MSLCPSEDLFLTASSDKTVRLWNIQQAGCVGKMDLPLAQTQGNPYVAFDSTGMVFAVMAEMTNSSSSVTAGGYYVHLYDARNFSGGAFSEMQVTNQSLLEAIVTHRVAATPPPQPPTLESISFNASGNRILVQSPGHGIAYVLDGYEGTVQRVFVSSKGSATCSCFTPDDQSLLLGSDAGMVECFNLQSGQMVRQLDGGHDGGPVGAVACNPKYKQIASSGADTWYVLPFAC
jgi:WD40 repeat protein